MSSEIYELMKRSDEVEVVERAHMHPRFVEDCVREMIRLAVDEFGHMGDEAFLLARQENLETIHRHSVVAERHGLMGELGRELREQVTVPHHVTRREWLEDRAAAGLRRRPSPVRGSAVRPGLLDAFLRNLRVPPIGGHGACRDRPVPEDDRRTHEIPAERRRRPGGRAWPPRRCPSPTPPRTRPRAGCAPCACTATSAAPWRPWA